MGNTRQEVSPAAQWLVALEEIQRVIGPNAAATKLKTLVSLASLCLLRILERDLHPGRARTS